MAKRLLGLLGPVVALGALCCAPRQAVTTWGYSSWYERYGASSMGTFESQRQQCLLKAGISADPASVAPESSQENAFLQCMNDAGWCTTAFDCNKPGA